MLDDLIDFIKSNDGINNKGNLAEKVSKEFSCAKKGSVYATSSFAIRFSTAKGKRMSNTVLALSKLEAYDPLPFLVCIVTPTKNYLLLANTTFLSKISHSSKDLREDNIKGSFNGSDIMQIVDGIDNSPENFATLFDMHEKHGFEENLVRLVKATKEIQPTGKRFYPTDFELDKIYQSPQRALDFVQSKHYETLLGDLDQRVKCVETEILKAAKDDNGKTRGNNIEYLISGDDAAKKNGKLEALQNDGTLLRPYLRNGLGDYFGEYEKIKVEIDIKTKIMGKPSAPKGYNIDKMLKFLSADNTVFMLYLVGIDVKKKIIETKLISIFQETLLATTKIQGHWAGRNSAGVSQFDGATLKRIIRNEENEINLKSAEAFLEEILGIGDEK